MSTHSDEYQLYHLVNYKCDATINKCIMHIIIALLHDQISNRTLTARFITNICANRIIHEEIFGLVLGSITISIVVCRDW